MGDEMFIESVKREVAAYDEIRLRAIKYVNDPSASPEKRTELQARLQKNPERLLYSGGYLASHSKELVRGRENIVALVLLGDNRKPYVVARIQVSVDLDGHMRVQLFDSLQGRIEPLESEEVSYRHDDDLSVGLTRLGRWIGALDEFGSNLIDYAGRTSSVGSSAGILSGRIGTSSAKSSTNDGNKPKSAFESNVSEMVYGGGAGGQRFGPDQVRNILDDSKPIPVWYRLFRSSSDRSNFNLFISDTATPIYNAAQSGRGKAPSTSEMWRAIETKGIKNGHLKSFCRTYKKGVEFDGGGVCVLAGKCEKYSRVSSDPKIRHCQFQGIEHK